MENNNDNIDWESRRFLIAMHAMHGIISNSHERDYRTESYGTTYKDPASKVASGAVHYANALIEELKRVNVKK